MKLLNEIFRVGYVLWLAFVVVGYCSGYFAVYPDALMICSVLAILICIQAMITDWHFNTYRRFLFNTESVTIHVPMHRDEHISIKDHQCCAELIKVLAYFGMDVEIRYVEAGILNLAGNRANIVIANPQTSPMIEKAIDECDNMPRFVKEDGIVKLKLRDEVPIICEPGKQYAFIGKTKDFLLIYGLHETGALCAIKWLCEPKNVRRLSKAGKLSYCLIRSDLINNTVKNPEMYAMTTTDSKKLIEFDDELE